MENINKNVKTTNKNNSKIIFILLAVIILVIALVVLINPKKNNQDNNIKSEPVKQTETSSNRIEFAPETAEQVIPEGAVEEKIEDKTLFKINLGVAQGSGFSPSEIPAFKAGNRLALSLSSLDDFEHSLVFDDQSLSDVVITVKPRESKLATFDLPAQPGTYTFHCNTSGHELEVGKIIIN